MCACVRTRSRFQVTQSRMLELRIHGRDNSFVTQIPLVLFTVCKRELPANPTDWLHLVIIFKCLRCQLVLRAVLHESFFITLGKLLEIQSFYHFTPKTFHRLSQMTRVKNCFTCLHGALLLQ